MGRLKVCDVGGHEVPVLFHSRKSDRPSCCLGCYRKTGSTTRDNPSSKVSIQNEKKVSVKRANEATYSKSIPDLLKLAQIVINKYVRERDSKDGMFTCISSGEYLPVSQMQAGHFFPISTSSYLRYDLSNIHGQSISENCFNPNHILTYRKNLIKKIGIKEVARLDYYHNREKKWSKDELLEIIQKYKI